jgi:hypothetical protein
MGAKFRYFRCTGDTALGLTDWRIGDFSLVLDLAVPRRIRGICRRAHFCCGTPAPLHASSEAGWMAEVICTPGEPVKVDRVVVADTTAKSSSAVSD